MKLKEKHTLEEYEALPEDSPYQLIMGEPGMSPASNPRHRKTLKRLFIEFFKAIEEKNLGKVLFAPVDVYLDEVYANEGGHMRLTFSAKDQGKVKSAIVEDLEIDISELFKEVL